MSKSKIIGIIPSRLASSRLPNKPLHKIFGLPLIAHVYLRARQATQLDKLIVATDAPIIVDTIHKLGGEAMLTSDKHQNGTERMGEVMQTHSANFYTLINGDEILLNPDSIAVSIDTLLNSAADASILAVRYKKEHSPSDFKLALNLANEVMYISRNDIPSSARNKVDHRLKAYHLMTFKKETLEAYQQLEKTPLEKIEDHEHLRLLEHGFKIKASMVDDECISLDTPEDIPVIEQLLQNDKVYNSYRVE